MDIRKFERAGMVAAGAVLVVFLVIGQKNVKKSDNGRGFGEINIEDNVTVQKADAIKKLDRPKTIVWETEDVDNKDKSESVVLEPAQIKDETLKEVAETMGFDWPSRQEIDGQIKIADTERKAYFEWKTKDGVLEAGENIERSEQLVAEKKLKTEEILKKVVMMAEKIRMVNEGERFEVEGVNFKKLVYPRWVGCTEKEAAAVEVMANLEIEGKKVMSANEEMVKAVVRMDGKILNFKMRIMGKQISRKAQENKFNGTKFGAYANEKARIFRVWGGPSADLEYREKEMEVVRATYIHNGFYWNENENRLIPYYWIEGNGINISGPVAVTLGVER